MPMIEISEEELESRRRVEVMGRLLDAWSRDDAEAARRIGREFAPSAEVLMHAKRVHGADWVRRQGYDMRHAEKAYGRDWLD